MKPNKKMRQAIADGKKSPNNKLVKCLACNGTGYYDHNGSPKCSSCNGTGYEIVVTSAV